MGDDDIFALVIIIHYGMISLVMVSLAQVPFTKAMPFPMPSTPWLAWNQLMLTNLKWLMNHFKISMSKN